MIDLLNKKPKLLVIGDLMIDHYLWGSCERISPEAPVQVINIDRESMHLGGAGNVINNLYSLGAEIDVISVIGDCHASEELKELLSIVLPLEDLCRLHIQMHQRRVSFLFYLFCKG